MNLAYPIGLMVLIVLPPAAYYIGKAVGQRDEARSHLRLVSLWREALVEARDRLLVAEGDARYERGNLIVAKTLTTLIGDDPW